MSAEKDLAEFREFLGDSGDAGKPAFNPATASDEDFARFLDDGKPDLEAMARKAKADKDAAEIQEYRDFARQQMESRGYDVEAGKWRTSEPAEESLVSTMPATYQDEHGSPLVTADRWEQFVDTESEMGALSADQFSRLLAARESGSDVVFGPEPPQEHEVDDLYSRFMLGEKVED